MAARATAASGGAAAATGAGAHEGRERTGAGAGESMSDKGTEARRLFDMDLPGRVGDMLRTVEGRAKQAVSELRGEYADVAPVVGFFDDQGRPFVAAADKKAAPSPEAVSLEIARLWLRHNRFEKNMPYAEMRHPANQRLCRRLYRILEQEIIASECETLGAPVRRWLSDRFEKLFIEPLAAGKYRTGEADPGRLREGALDALELALGAADDKTPKRLGVLIAESDAGIARSFGLMFRVVEQHRPFENEDRVRAAYYLAVPFLFDARKPSTPIVKTRPS